MSCATWRPPFQQPSRYKRVRKNVKTEFSVAVRKFADALGMDLVAVLTRTGMELQERAAALTPVDTGRARASWNLAVDTVDPENAPKGNTNKKYGNRDVKGAKPTSTLFVSNNLPYIVQLERGSSRQNPKGMLRVAVPQMKRYMQDVVKRRHGNS